MKKVAIADATLREGVCRTDVSLSFKEKLETAKLLDKLGVDIIETAPITDEKTDTLLLRTLCPLLKNSVLSCPAGLTAEELERTWSAISASEKPHLLISAPVSSVQMEYLCHKKPAGMLETVKAMVSAAKEKCGDVEFAAVDATRADKAFLYSVIGAAIENGASTVTVCDTSGTMLPDEFSDFIAALYENVPELKNVVLGVECSDALDMASACSLACLKAGAALVKTNTGSKSCADTKSVANAISVKSNQTGIFCSVDTMAISHTVPKILRMTAAEKDTSNPFGYTPANHTGNTLLGSDATIADISRAASRLGYDLSEDDTMKVYRAFTRLAEKKQVGTKELDSIIASEANQVPQTYTVSSYVINAGNIITSTANIVLEKNGRLLQGVAVGDGPIDAAFLTVEQIIGHHYELDDFQIQSVTEGREAMGEALVKLRYRGRTFAGRGISTDIIGAAIDAYISALNKIVYEEN